ncbi:MAG: carboxypeptidase regulatory-like domain-containing protein [Acidobacteria bacterium]|nr:carboxypeptidase regulatory-like domain-containing protein [Acidobacteriota bacterium]
MLSTPSVFLTVLLLCSTAFGQSGAPTTRVFHVRGAITDLSGAVITGAKVEFHNAQFDKTVTTNQRGVYEADIPFGDSTMTVQAMGFKSYRRPLFPAK